MNWTEQESNLAKKLKWQRYSYKQIRKELKLIGSNKSKEAIRKFLKRTENKSIKNSKSFPKILIFDIETLPIQSYVWGLFKQNIPIEMIIKDWCALSWSAKWLFDSKMYSDILTPYEAPQRSDKRILKGIWDLLEECDICVAHNGTHFDVKKLKARFFCNKMKPTTPFAVIDTLEQSRKTFGFTSHKLNWITQIISRKEKLHTDFELWRQCDQGNRKALKRMLEYNNYDVTLLEEVFLEMLPWFTSVPNIGVYLESKEPVCGHCGSTSLNWRGSYITPAGKYKSFRCNDCGGIGRSRFSSLDKETRKALVVNTAK
jgi:hypothetical protein